MPRLALCALVLALSSCASIVSKSDWPVTISSNPAGAQFSVTDAQGKCLQTGVTPSTVTLKSGDGYFKKSRYAVHCTKDGFQPADLDLRPQLNPWFWGNLLFGGVIGFLVVDPLTGAMWKLGDGVTVQLAPVGPSP